MNSVPKPIFNHPVSNLSHILSSPILENRSFPHVHPTAPFLYNSSLCINGSYVFNSCRSFPNLTSWAENVSLITLNEISTNPLEWSMMGLTLIIACTTVGNLLVCLAVCWEKRLQNMTNYFLMSLAIADLLVSLLVMPLGMIVEIFGRFPMNPEVCVLWVASDVLMCSASIWHMCTMSMDRYFTLKYPMRYGRNKTRRMVVGKILFVWVVSVAISSPVCIHGFIDTSSVFRDGECVPKVKNFVIYGSVFAFYIPLLIMIITYVLTIRILWKNQQRMKHIDRSDMKPRLAQLTAQCTGFAIPKLLTGLRKSTKSTSSLRVTMSRSRSKKRHLTPGTSQALSAHSMGHDNVASDADFIDDSRGGRGRNQVGMVYLSPPSPQTCTPGSCSPTSVRGPVNSDTEESESDTHYFSLQTSHSCRSLCTPVSLTTSEKSLHRRLQKKQLLQQQQQELHSLRQEYHHQRQFHHNRDEELSLSSSPPDDKPEKRLPIMDDCSISMPSSPLSPQSPTLNEEVKHLQKLSHSTLALPSLKTSLSSPKLCRTSSKEHKEADKKLSKKKRYSKRSKKRRNSLTQEGGQTNHLEVPSPRYFTRGRSSKQTSGHTVLTNAVSDTQVSQAGRGIKSHDETNQGVSSFHLSYNNLSKDYKSLEWDRRYFQIQDEMDRCLKGEFGRWDRRQSKQGPTTDVQCEDIKNEDIVKEADERTCPNIYPENKTFSEICSEKDTTPEICPEKEILPEICHEKEIFPQICTGRETSPERSVPKMYIKPEISLPVSDPLNVSYNLIPTGYSHSAPNSPLNRRNTDAVKVGFSSDDDAEYELENEENSDRTNDDDGNDTSGSSNSDVITIRLHPPTPKVRSCNSDENMSNHSFSNSESSGHPTGCTKKTASCLNIPANSMLNMTHTKTGHLNGIPHFNSSSNISKHSNSNTSHSLLNGAVIHSLTPSSSSPLPELVISSEGEMTLDETDDTIEDSPRNQRVKLRRPTHLYSQRCFKSKHSPSGSVDDPFRPSSYRSTFRIHRGKGAVKHILSKKTATNERKASKVLGIIFLVFVILWTPFFTVNIMNAICDTCMEDFNRELMSLFLWMGYVASLANPIIYTMFNTAFRRTFIRILTCKIRSTCGTKTSDTHYMSYTTTLASERRNTMTVVLRDESR